MRRELCILGNPGTRLSVKTGEDTFGAGEGENKTGNRTARRIVEEKQRKRLVGGRGVKESATGRRIPAGTTGDVNQWVIRATVPQEGESRPCILHNSKGGWRGRGLACTRERWILAP